MKKNQRSTSGLFRLLLICPISMNRCDRLTKERNYCGGIRRFSMTRLENDVFSLLFERLSHLAVICHIQLHKTTAVKSCTAFFVLLR